MSALPPKPNLEQLKNQAKDLRKAHKTSDPEVAKRIRERLPRLADRSEQEILEAQFSLQEAQHGVARENGFRSWWELHVAAVPAGDPLPEDGAQSDWRTRFDAVYHLKRDEVLKQIPLPFIPERTEYYLAAEPSQVAVQVAEGSEPQPPDSFFLRWDDERIQKWGYGYVGDEGLSLADLLWHILRIPTWDYDGPQDVMAFQISGDWIFRPTAPMGKKLAALAEIWSSELNRSFEFERVTVSREAIVASGKFELAHLIEDKPNELFMYLSREELSHLDSDTAGGWVESMEDFLLEISNRVGMPVQNQVSNDFDHDLQVGTLRSSRLHTETDKKEKAQKLDILLRNLSAQSGLSFSLAPQQTKIWRVREKA